MEYSWGLVWTPVAFAIALLAPLLLFPLQQRKGSTTVLPALLLTLPLLPSYFLLHAQVRSPSIRALLSFPLCWIFPNRLLLLCFHALDCPAWSFSSPSHFLLSVLLPIRIKGPVSSSSSSTSANVLSSYLLCLLYELLALACVAICLVYAPVYARYPLFFLSAFLTMDVPSRAAAIVFHVLYGVELHAAFNNPWLPYSLTEFWGRRWNLIGNALLRQSVYNPMITHLSAVRKERSKDPVAGGGGGGSGEQEVELWVRVVAVCTTFFCSGLIHELMWFCILQERRWRSWENTWFFVLHGLATSAEISCRRLLPHLSPKIPGFLKLACTLAFVHTTMAWLLFAPQNAMPKEYF